MEFDAEGLRKQIPYYLTAGPEQKALIDGLRAFGDGVTPNYYLATHFDTFQDEMLQGDGWTGFEVFLFDSGARRQVRGIVLSNSCDVSPDNKRDTPTRITFAPLVKLSEFRALLMQSGISPATVDAKVASIVAQRTTNMFYLPAGGPLTEDYVVRFDDVHSMPFQSQRSGKKLFTLSMVGFYLFVLKLSVHFCRLQENVNRSGTPVAS